MKKTTAANPDHVRELFLIAENTEILYKRYFFPRGGIRYGEYDAAVVAGTKYFDKMVADGRI